MVKAIVQLESLESLALCLQAADTALPIDLGGYLGTIIGGDNRRPAGRDTAFGSAAHRPCYLPTAGGLLPRPTLRGSILHLTERSGGEPVRIPLCRHTPQRKTGEGDAELRKACAEGSGRKMIRSQQMACLVPEMQ